MHGKEIPVRVDAQTSAEEYTEALPEGSTARFIRVIFERTNRSSSVKLAEVKVTGRPL
jgi:hypothetical protein